MIVCVCVFVRVCHLCVHVWMYVGECMYVCLYVCMCVCLYHEPRVVSLGSTPMSCISCIAVARQEGPEAEWVGVLGRTVLAVRQTPDATQFRSVWVGGWVGGCGCVGG
jgi:hypothetical protein